MAPLVIVALANAFDWHTAFYLTIIPGIILAFFILKSVKNPEKVILTAFGLVSTSSEKVGFKDVIKHRNIGYPSSFSVVFMIYVMAFPDILDQPFLSILNIFLRVQ